MTSFDIGEFFTFCPALAEMIRTNSLVGRSGKQFVELGALSSVNNLVTLRRLALHFKPQRTLEVGLGFGGSCLAITATHRDLGAAPCRQHFALDPFQTHVWDDAGLAAMEQAGLLDFLDFRPNYSSLELPRLVETRESFALVYIDGSHIFEDVFVDFYYVSRLLTEGGVVAFDDSTDPNVRKVLDFIRKNLRSALVEMDLAPYRADKGASLRFRAARLLGKTQMTAFRRVGDVVRPWNAAFNTF